MMYALSWARLRPGRRSTPGDHEPVELPDGRCVVLRPVSPGDDAAEQSFVRALSTGSRVLRFHAGMRELPPPLLRALTHVDQRSHVAVVAEHDDGSERAIVADARYVRLDDSAEAEFAIAVADDWQRLGLGRRLMQRLAQNARRQGLTHLVGDVMRDNARMLALLRDTGAKLQRHPGDATLVRARLAL